MTSEDLAATMVRHAARRAPVALRDRLEEEWLADLAGRRETWVRLRLALGCFWATHVIVADQFAAGAPQTVKITLHDSTAALASHDPSHFSRRSIVLLMILSVHALIIYAFITGLATRVVRHLPPAIAVFLPLPVTSRAAEFKTPVQVPRLALQRQETLIYPKIDLLPVTEDVIATPPTLTARHDNVEQAVAPPARHVGGPGSGFPATEDYYPAASRRVGEQGISAVQVCVDTAGYLTSEPGITQSSGIARLDEGALRLARAGSGHYRSTLENGKPITDCYAFRIRFVLNP